MKMYFFAGSLITSLLISPLAHADEVTDAVDEGLTQYKEGRLSDAAGQFEYAATLIRQQRAEGLKALFPDALSGWSAEDVQSGSAGAMIGGGIVSGSRSYRKDNASIEISLAMDSPMLQGVMMMFSNPAYATMGGGKLTKVKGEKAIVKTQGDSIELTLALNGKVLVTIKGNNASEKDVTDYTEALDFKKISEF